MSAIDYRGDTVFPRNSIKTAGTVVGTRACQVAGCRGVRLITRWPNGNRTMPCTKGMLLVHSAPNSSRVWVIL